MHNKQNGKIKTEWNLGLLYKSDSDPQIQKDVEAVVAACEEFAKKYEGKTDYTESVSKLHGALLDYEKLQAMPEAEKSMSFFHYTKDLEAGNKKAEQKTNQLSQIFTKAYNKILFFELALGKIDPKLQEQFLINPELKHFSYFLKNIFEQSKHTLTLPEEKIMNLKSLPSSSMWIHGSEKLLNKQTVRFKNKDLPIAEALNKIPSLPPNDRRNLQREISTTLKSISDFAESEINALYTNKKINDELRGYKEPYSASILHYQNDEKSIINLVNTVTKLFSISHKFYKLKAQLLKLPHLEYADRAVGIGKNSKKINFEESLTTLKRVFGKLGPQYLEILEQFMEQGHVDVYPKKRKTGGAYCSSGTGLPTFVLLNHVSDFKSLMTFAHEMGHAIHAEFSKSQPPLYQGHTISVAEVASTLFENFVFEEVYETLSNKEKIVALHDRIGDDISTIFRQIACFNFELELHQKIRAEGAISKEDIATTHNKHMKAYLGPKVKLHEDDGYFFVQWSHIRRFFYVYSYAYGQLISKALYERYKADKSYLKEIEKFLHAGGSKSPEDIFKDIGVDTSKPQFFVDGLKSIEKDIGRLAKLTNY